MVIGFDEAVRRVVEAAHALETERVALSSAVGRTLAESVAGDLDVPPFDTTAMDGWAVRAADASAGALLRDVGAVGAGAAPARPLEPGEALKVMTGAPLPSGADAVVPVEEAALDGERVRVEKAPKPRAHVRTRGEVIAKGEKLLEPGRRLSAADLAVAAAAGRSDVRVARRPRVAVLVTGDEIVPPHGMPGPAQIRNTNGPLLVAALQAAGAEALDLGVARDREDALEDAVTGALASGIDALLTTGGVSAGDWDLLPGVLGRLGAEVLFHKVALRPAKPLLFARLGPALVFGLPGNPVSTAVAFDMFVRSALRKMTGISPAGPHFVEARLSSPVKNKGPRLALHPARAVHEGVLLTAAPLATKGSHDLAAHARANSLLRLEPESEFGPGATVPVFLAHGGSTLG
jgi:molybdopterin molybdotransferase